LTIIELTKGKNAIIDVIDRDLAERSWHAVPGYRSIGNYTFYAARRKGNKSVTLHRVRFLKLFLWHFLKTLKNAIETN
jgi:hypothetical protein